MIRSYASFIHSNNLHGRVLLKHNISQLRPYFTAPMLTHYIYFSCPCVRNTVVVFEQQYYILQDT